MAEVYKRFLEEFVDGEDKRTLPMRNRVNEIRERLEGEARIVANIYRLETDRLRPSAQEGLEKVVLPWWREFHESALCRQMTELLKPKLSFRLTLSDPIPYIYPEAALKADFRYEAESIYKSTMKGRELNELVERSRRSWEADEWTATGYFSGLGDEFHKLSLQSWSVGRECYAFAVHSQWLRIDLDPLDERGDPIGRIHPAVFIGWAQQIQRGRVWGLLDKSFKDSYKGS